jgi:hypothetical protein
MDDEVFFNSSDIEMDPVVKPHLNAGQKSITAMFESRFDDRKMSKKRLRTLTDTRGAPGSIYIRALWLNRIESYAKISGVE